ncbi:Peroxisomal sarcosine oxidase [Heterocephalus glaber]|uniref:Peroxisomal sarcosine oxidase n=1 Tax=Heterocephalus glaber TaxID=10181 RepID=G5BVJ3_HETGA|nr:peroxisomal sarcosine oxidase isoform X1 [Heterocephalus glaber]EHB13329.1 Peroxisomal sarcosine oxidase [Heterocephalus glaber]
MAAQKDLWDAIVIGAGIQGCFTTYHLAKHGKRVLLLEQFLLPHSRGSSHGQSRIIRKVYSEDFYTQMMDECYWMWAQLERESGTPLYRKTELLLLGKENPELKTMQATLSRQGIEYQYLSSEELKQRFPNLRLTNEEVGLLDKTGGVLYADKALRALQDAIHQFGGTVKDGEKVMEIIPGLPVRVKTTCRSYQAKSLVISAGPWTNQLLQPLGIELPLQTLRINVCYWPEKVPGSYSVSQAFPCFMWLGLAPHSIYGLPSGEYPGLMKVCYHHGNSADPEERDYPMAPSDTQDVQILCRIVKDRFPDLKPEPAIMERCIYTNTPDKHFVLDRHPKYDNIVIGAGFSGHGFKLAPVVGKILYELSMKLMLSYDLAPFRISRFSGLGKAHL